MEEPLILHWHSTDSRKFQYLRAFFTKFICCSGNQFLRSCDKNLPACKRQFLIPAEFLSQCTDFAHNNNSRRLDSLTLHFFFQSGNCSHDAFLSCCGSLLEDRCRHIFIHSCIHKSCTDIRKCGHTHKKYQGTFCVNKSAKINVVLLSCTLMSRNNVHRRTEISVCHRNSVVCRNCDGRGNSRNHLISDSVLLKKLQLLAASSEKKRVSAFQSYYAMSFLRLLKKHLIDILLAHDVMAGTFSHVDQLRLCRDP